MAARVAYVPNAKAPLWERTIGEIFDNDRELIAYMQRALGYSLTGLCSEEALFVNWGDGANGKGTIMNTVGWVLGDYYDNLSFSALELRERNGGSASPELAKLPGKRFVTASESSDTVRLNEARIKAMTGRDPITARGMYENEFTFEPSFKLWLATNHKPVVRDDSEGFWRRLYLNPFTVSFRGREDLELKDKLRGEAAGILAWLVRGVLGWQKQRLNPPAAVKTATAEYRRENDPLTPFFETCCQIAKTAKVAAGELFDAYLRWYNTSDLPADRRLNQKTFGLQVRKHFKVVEKRNVFYEGIRIKRNLQG
jgi:putative DNA primase/helicase